MDRRLREAERSGDAAVLRARLRAGELTQEHVELAASLGHAAALELFPDVSRVNWLRGNDAGNVIWRVAALLDDETLSVRVSADFAERVLSVFERTHREDTRPREAIAASRAWAARPHIHSSVARRAGDAAGVARRAGDAAGAASRDADAAFRRVAHAKVGKRTLGFAANLAAKYAAEAASDAASVATLADAAKYAAEAANHAASVATLAGAAKYAAEAANHARHRAARAAMNARTASYGAGATDAATVYEYHHSQLNAHDAAHDAAHDDAHDDAEPEWQRLRLAAYLLGEVETNEPAV
jgi:hypothetical protein